MAQVETTSSVVSRLKILKRMLSELASQKTRSRDLVASYKQTGRTGLVDQEILEGARIQEKMGLIAEYYLRETNTKQETDEAVQFLQSIGFETDIQKEDRSPSDEEGLPDSVITDEAEALLEESSLDIKDVTGTGKDGRVLVGDVRDALEKKEEDSNLSKKSRVSGGKKG